MSFEDKVRQAYMMELNQLPFYAALAEMAPNPVWAEQIRIMQENEMRHAQYLASLLGMPAQSMSTEPLQERRPTSFIEGIREARVEEIQQALVFDELERMAPTPEIKVRMQWIEFNQMRDTIFFANILAHMSAMHMTGTQHHGGTSSPIQGPPGF
ncbi:MAG TPA: ferritin-like domain-containing protein [Firmicutes bacterium]|nr:ferritin-like domain-containing protein [Bacillota bacterium]